MTSCGPRWEKWIKRFENYLVAVNITNDERKQALLLLIAGEKVHEIYDTIQGDADKYVDTKNKLTDYFQPMKDTHMAVYHFRELTQSATEKIDQFVTRLRALGKQCDFANMDDEIHGQILQKTSSKSLRREILKHPRWTLKDVLDEARSVEGERVNIVNSYKARNNKRQIQTPAKLKSQATNDLCYNCGRSWPHPEGRSSCPARGKKCTKCGKSNHFASVCRMANTSNTRNTKQTRKIHNVTNETPDADYNEACYTFHINSSNDIAKVPHTNIVVNNKPIRFMIDSGSSINIINPETHKQLGEPKLIKTRITALAYGSDVPLHALGYFEATVESQNEVTLAKIVVITLLSYDTATELGVLQIHATLNTVNNYSGTAPMESDRLIREFPQLFAGVGKLRLPGENTYR